MTSIFGKPKSFESPISAFNNLILQITENLSLFYTGEKNNADFASKLLFEMKSITIYGCIKVCYENKNIGIKFIGTFTDFTWIKKTIKHQQEIYHLFNQYLFIINNVSNNLDDSISQKYVESIFNQITENKISEKQMFLVPYKTKIKRLYDTEDKTLEKLFNKYSYIVQFKSSDTHFRYKLIRVLSNNLDESKSLENIRFEDIEILKENTLSKAVLKTFLVDLFYYGELNL